MQCLTESWSVVSHTKIELMTCSPGKVEDDVSLEYWCEKLVEIEENNTVKYELEYNEHPGKGYSGTKEQV